MVYKENIIVIVINATQISHSKIDIPLYIKSRTKEKEIVNKYIMPVFSYQFPS